MSSWTSLWYIKCIDCSCFLPRSCSTVWRPKTWNASQLVTRSMCVFHLLATAPPHSPPISHLCPSGPHFSRLPLPSSFRTRLFLFLSPGSLHRKLYTLGAFRKAESSFPVSCESGHKKKKNGWRGAVIPKLLNQERNRSQLFSSPHFTSLPFTQFQHFKNPCHTTATSSYRNTECLRKCHKEGLDWK